jgi:hypothetical protein
MPGGSGATELPGDVFTAHHARYFTTNLILERRRHGTRLKPLNRREGKTPLAGEFAAGPLHLLVLKSQDEIGSRPPRAVDCSRGMPAAPARWRADRAPRGPRRRIRSWLGFLSRPTSRSGGTRNSFCNFHIAIGDEKTSAANLITRTADSSIGGSILLLAN